jgi:hypothetical protein
MLGRRPSSVTKPALKISTRTCRTGEELLRRSKRSKYAELNCRALAKVVVPYEEEEKIYTLFSKTYFTYRTPKHYTNRAGFSEYTFFLCFEESTSLLDNSLLTAARAFADRACGNI